MSHVFKNTLAKRPSLGRIIVVVVNAFCVTHLFMDRVGRPALTDGASMIPTLSVQGDVVWEDRRSVRQDRTKFARGELVSFKTPYDPLRIACKRIIGLPGDIICVDPTGRLAPSDQHVIVPLGHVWVAGDNMANSRDSRQWGPLPMGLIEGRVVATVWPPSRFTIFKSPMKSLEE